MASPWADIKVLPNGSTLLNVVLPQSRDINDIHVVTSNTELIPGGMDCLEHGQCPIAL